MTKYKLLNTSEEFSAMESDIKSKLGIPDSKGTLKYADERVIDNPEHADHGKILFPVLTAGDWKCDQHFDASELVDFDSNWFATPEEIL